MKKGLCILLSAMLILGAVGCADNGSNTASKAASGNADSASESEAFSVEAALADVSLTTGTATLNLADAADSATPLGNPDKGWYLHYYDDSAGNNYGNHKPANDILDYMPYLDHVYMRLPWSCLEPQEGAFQWDIIDDVLNDFAEHGVGVSFRITCKEGGSYCPYATPKWVSEAGAEGAILSDGAWLPKYDDPIFLQKLENFHKAFAARYAGKEGLRYVDVGCYGDYGEGHHSASNKSGWPTGWAKDWGWDTIEKLFDIYEKYYPNNQIVVSDDFVGSRAVSTGKTEIKQYVLNHGWTWRDDSICVNWFVQNYSATDTVRSPDLFEAVWKDQPVIMELEHYKETIDTSYHEDNWKGGTTFMAACKRTHATYAGWHGFINQFVTPSNLVYVKEMANRLGYWYFLDKVDFARDGNNLTCKLDWRNEGFAKAYNKYDFDIILTDATGKDTVFTQADFDNTAFMPKDAADANAVAPVTTTSHTLDLSGLAGGEYYLSVRMHKGETPVLLALDQERKGEDGRYYLAKVTL